MPGFHGLGRDHPVLPDRLRMQKPVAKIINETQCRFATACLECLGCHPIIENLFHQLSDAGAVLSDHSPVFGIGVNQQTVKFGILVNPAAMLAHKVKQQAFKFIVRGIGRVVKASHKASFDEK